MLCVLKVHCSVLANTMLVLLVVLVSLPRTWAAAQSFVAVLHDSATWPLADRLARPAPVYWHLDSPFNSCLL